MNLGQNIIKLRKEKGYSQEKLGELVGVTRQTISNWELNETIPDTNQLISLSKALNINLDNLVNSDIKKVDIEDKNTEKLAGIIIKILKIFGILVIINLVIAIIAFILFNVYPKEVTKNGNLSAILNCSIEENEYKIIIGDGNYFNCDKCSKEMKVYLKDITDFAHIEHSIENINTYFKENGGICE